MKAKEACSFAFFSAASCRACAQQLPALCDRELDQILQRRRLDGPSKEAALRILREEIGQAGLGVHRLRPP